MISITLATHTCIHVHAGWGGAGGLKGGGGGGRQGCKDNSLEIVIEQMTLGGAI